MHDSHRFHAGLPGYDADNELHDDCPRCADYADGVQGLLNMDEARFERLWRLMLVIEYDEKMEGDDAVVKPERMSKVQSQVLTAMYRLSVIQERYFGLNPRELP
jgi:hypothetical protein